MRHCIIASLHKYYLSTGAEGVKSIELSIPNASGGFVNADPSLLKKVERIWLENLDGYTDLRGVTITAMSETEKLSGQHQFRMKMKTKALPI